MPRTLAVAAACLVACACAPRGEAARPTPAPLPQGAVMTPLPAKAVAAVTAAEPGACAAEASGACRGCRVSCPAGYAASCWTGVTDYGPLNGGRPPVCRQEPYCGCEKLPERPGRLGVRRQARPEQ